MGFPYVVPTINEPMCSYTAMTFGFIFVVAPIIGVVAYNWAKREIDRIDKEMVIHNKFITDVSVVINDVHTDIAVIKERVGGTQIDMVEIKESLAGIDKILWEQFAK